MIELNGEIDALDNKIAGRAAARSLRCGEEPLARPAWSGSSAMSIWSRGWPRSSSITARASRRCRARSRRRCRTRAPRRARRALADLMKAGVPDDLARRIASLPACWRRPTSCWSPTAPAAASPMSPRTYFAARALFPAGTHRACRARHSGLGLFRPARARPRARLARRGDAPASPPRCWRAASRPRGGGGLGRAARGRGRPHPQLDARDRRYRAHAVEARVAASLLGDLARQ